MFGFGKKKDPAQPETPAPESGGTSAKRLPAVLAGVVIVAALGYLGYEYLPGLLDETPPPVPKASKPAGAAKAPAPKPVPVAAAPVPKPEPKPAPAMTPVAAPAAAALKFNDIMTAVLYRDREAVAKLLDLGRWADKPDSNGFTPLMAAVHNRDYSMV